MPCRVGWEINIWVVIQPWRGPADCWGWSNVKGQESRWHLHTQGTLFYLGRAPGDYKGHLFWKVPGQLQEVDPKEGCPCWEPPVPTEDQQSLKAALVAGQKALGGKSQGQGGQQEK